MENTCKQAWFADDSAAAGKMEGIRKWWGTLNQNAPPHGILPKFKQDMVDLKK